MTDYTASPSGSGEIFEGFFDKKYLFNVNLIFLTALKESKVLLIYEEYHVLIQWKSLM
jgi:hypothetical protein